MVAFNFKKDFVPAIQHGTKFSTIRKTKRCNVGDKMQLYTGQRTKHCQKIADAVCVGVARIEIDDNSIFRVLGFSRGLYPDDCPVNFNKLNKNYESIADQEGFDRYDDFVDFFIDHYGLPFTGYMHVWRLDNE